MASNHGRAWIVLPAWSPQNVSGHPHSPDTTVPGRICKPRTWCVGYPSCGVKADASPARQRGHLSFESQLLGSTGYMQDTPPHYIYLHQSRGRATVRFHRCIRRCRNYEHGTRKRKDSFARTGVQRGTTEQTVYSFPLTLFLVPS